MARQYAHEKGAAGSARREAVMSALNQFLNGLNQNWNLQTGFYPIEKNPVFASVSGGQGRPLERNLNQFVNGFRAPSRGAMMMTDRASQ
jgi:hypothetical protein